MTVDNALAGALTVDSRRQAMPISCTVIIRCEEEAMDLVMIQYIEVNMIGITILLIMLFYILGTHGVGRGAHKFFVKLLICNVITLLSDVGIYFMRGNNLPALVAINHFFCIIYFISHACFGYLWVMYTIKKLFPDYEPGRKTKWLIMLPALMNSLFTITSPWTKWVYYLTDENRYMRGEYMPYMSIITYGYWLVSVIVTLKELIRPKVIREAEVYWTLLLFPIPTAIGNILQMRFYGLSIVWVCSAISLLILFINIQNYQLSRDILTGLFNRRQTDKQLAWEINRLETSDDKLFVMMIDVDNFKRINDEFGHLIGDQALITVSDILKKSYRAKDFIGRFGGDEFIIIGHANNKAEIDALIDSANDTIAAYNNSGTLIYTLSLSAGYQMYSKEDRLSIDSIISSADAEMYRIKSEKALNARTSSGNLSSSQ